MYKQSVQHVKMWLRNIILRVLQSVCISAAYSLCVLLIGICLILFPPSSVTGCCPYKFSNYMGDHDSENLRLVVKLGKKK